MGQVGNFIGFASSFFTLILRLVTARTKPYFVPRSGLLVGDLGTFQRRYGGGVRFEIRRGTPGYNPGSVSGFI